MSESQISRPATQAHQDARDLLERLYREIGTSAVSAALQLREPTDPRETPRETAEMKRGDDLAA